MDCRWSWASPQPTPTTARCSSRCSTASRRSAPGAGRADAVSASCTLTKATTTPTCGPTAADLASPRASPVAASNTWPGITALVLTIWVAAWALLFGGLELHLAFQHGELAGERVMSLIGGLASMALGVVLLVRPRHRRHHAGVGVRPLRDRVRDIDPRARGPGSSGGALMGCLARDCHRIAWLPVNTVERLTHGRRRR